MRLYLTLKSYLQRLDDISSKPIPSLKDIAEGTGTDYIHFLNIVNNKTKSLNLETAHAIITEMRRRGFDMQINDLLVYVPPPDDSASE